MESDTSMLTSRSRLRPRLRIASTALGFVVALTRTAAATDLELPAFISPGIVWSTTSQPQSGSGAGFELSAGAYVTRPTLPPGVHVGLLYRGQSYGAFGRRTVAAQVGYSYFGLEAGWAWRDGTGAEPPAQRVHLSPHVSIGILYLGPQLLIRGNVEYGFNLGLKFPLPHLVVAPFLVLLGAALSCC
jgi:hypothetical protein